MKKLIVLVIIYIGFFLITPNLFCEINLSKYTLEKNIQIYIESHNNVYVADKEVTPNKVGKQLLELNMKKTKIILLMHDPGVDEKTIKTVIYSLIDAGYYSVITFNK